jgi:pimeloyl-ACP methyl ester carboxylesterase
LAFVKRKKLPFTFERQSKGKKTMKIVCLESLITSLAMTTLCLLSDNSRAAESITNTKPTIVLVHGAFAESASWNGVLARLLADGYPVATAANPLRGLKCDSDYVASLFSTIRGPIVAVGHSYAGSVISDAAVGNSNVKALVFVAGLAPEVGESAADISEHFPGSTLGPTLATPVSLSDGGKDLYIQQDKFPKQFAGDIPETEAKLLAATQRPVTDSALHDPSGPPAWKTIPSWFIFGSLDKNITEAAHLFMARRAGAKEIIDIKGASHVVMISHPDEVTQIIEHAAQSLSTEQSSPDDVLMPSKSTATDPSQNQGFNPAPVVSLASQPPARLIVDSPLPAQLATGYVVIRYRVENLRILPVYGPSASKVSPRIGHLHITVDDLPWHWLDASGEPLSINGLPPGRHSVLIELEDPTHKAVDRAIINFEIPPRSNQSVKNWPTSPTPELTINHFYSGQ